MGETPGQVGALRFRRFPSLMVIAAKFQEMAVQLWAALQKGIFTLPLSSAPPTQKGDKLNDNDGTIAHSPEVLQLLEDLRVARESAAVTAADLAQAESVLADLAAQRGRLDGQLKASEQALALSGALPEEAFTEEAELAAVDRRIRVAKSRVQLIGGKQAESRANVDRLRSALRVAFSQFITSRLTEVRARYRAATLVLRDLYAEQMAWCDTALFAGVKVPPTDIAVIFDSEPIGNARALLDNRFIRLGDEWKKFSGPLHTQLTALHAEVTTAIGGAEAKREAKPKASQSAVQTLGPGSTETLYLTMEHAGSAAIQTGPAEAGAHLPDLAEYGIGVDSAAPGRG